MRIKSITKEIHGTEILFYLTWLVGIGAYLYQALTGPWVITELAVLGVSTPDDLRNCVLAGALFCLGAKIVYYWGTTDRIIERVFGLTVDYLMIGALLHALFFSPIAMGTLLLYVLIRLITAIIPNYNLEYEDGLVIEKARLGAN